MPVIQDDGGQGVVFSGVGVRGKDWEGFAERGRERRANAGDGNVESSEKEGEDGSRPGEGIWEGV